MTESIIRQIDILRQTIAQLTKKQEAKEARMEMAIQELHALGVENLETVEQTIQQKREQIETLKNELSSDIDALQERITKWDTLLENV